MPVLTIRLVPSRRSVYYLSNSRITPARSPEPRNGLHIDASTFAIHDKSDCSRVGFAITSLSVVSFHFVYTIFSPKRKEA